jgi:hypothetical protein
MDTIIGIGAAGCRIADEFEKYPQYDIYKIDVGISGPNCYSIPVQKSHQDYEENIPDLQGFLGGVEGDVLVVVGGGGKVSGITLRVMSQLKGCTLHVLYVRPVLSQLNQTAFLQERLVFNVFQEYARSGVFRNLYLFSNESLEDMVGDVSLLEFNSALNKQIVNAIHFVNIFNHSQPILDSSEPPKEIARICTFGVQNIKDGSEKDMFPIQNICNKIYYYAIKEDDLKTDTKLIKNIREQISKNEIRPSYQIHSTKYPESFCYTISYSSRIQSA